MEDTTLKLPVGLLVDGTLVHEAPFAETGGPAEEIYTTKPGSTGLYTWFGEVLAVSIKSIGTVQVAAPFIKKMDRDRAVPKVIKDINLNDVGTALLQVQRTCWQQVLEQQQFACQRCGTQITADVDLDKIEVVVDETTGYPEIIVRLRRTYTVGEQTLEGMKEFEGQQFNAMRFRPPVLGDALRHEKLSVDKLLFWRNIAFDCALGFMLYVPAPTEDDPEAEVGEEVLEGYLSKRGMKLFTTDLRSDDSRAIRSGMTTKLPGAKFYYEDTCACGKYQVPFFTEPADFFA